MVLSEGPPGDCPQNLRGPIFPWKERQARCLSIDDPVCFLDRFRKLLENYRGSPEPLLRHVFSPEKSLSARLSTLLIVTCDIYPTGTAEPHRCGVSRVTVGGLEYGEFDSASW